MKRSTKVKANIYRARRDMLRKHAPDLADAIIEWSDKKPFGKRYLIELINQYIDKCV